MARTSLAVLRPESETDRAMWFEILGKTAVDLVLVVEPEGRVLYVAPTAHKVLGLEADDLMGSGLLDRLSSRESAAFRRALKRWSAAAEPADILELGVPSADGNTVELELAAANLLDVEPIHALVLTGRETPERDTTEMSLGETQARLLRAAQGAADGLWDWDIPSGEVHFSERLRQMFGLKDSSFPSSLGEWLERIHPEDQQHFRALLAAHLDGHTETLESDFRVLQGDGTYRWVLCRGQVVRNRAGKALRCAGAMLDISERKFFDALTGLPNRRTFRDSLQRIIDRPPQAQSKLFAVLILDLDRFKVINDSLGHGTGDRVLISVARRLETCVRAGDLVGRLGGDEFCILLDGLEDLEEAGQITEQIRKLLAQPNYVGSTEVFSTVSIGLAFSSKGYEQAGDMLRDADTALHRAKRAGRDRSETFRNTMHIESVRDFKMEVDLHRAVRRDEFRVRYQPLVDLDSGRLSGFEALVRWEHPEQGFVSPMDFIPLAEEVGLIAPIDRWVLGEASRQARQWQKDHATQTQLQICVNVSSKQFSRSGLVEHVAGVLRDADLEPGSLKLEITESAIMDNPEQASQILGDLREMGVRLALDDFGTGYSSLSHLQRFPFDTIKIDRSFVKRLEDDEQNQAIVRTIVGLANSLKMDVVAEGVETSAQLELIRELGCRFGQGWHFARPLADTAAGELIGSDPSW